MKNLIVCLSLLVLSFGINSCFWAESVKKGSLGTCGGAGHYENIVYTKKIEFISLYPMKKDASITPPQIIGGSESLISKIGYPDVAYKWGICGRVMIGFEIGPIGYAENIVALKSLGANLEQEVIKALNSQKFIPPKRNGKYIGQTMVLEIKFDLEKI